MFFVLEVREGEDCIREEQITAIKNKMLKIVKENELEVADFYYNTSYPLIKSEIQYRSDNYNDFNMQRKLTEKEINTIANEIFNNYEDLYDNLLDIIDEKIEKLE